MPVHLKHFTIIVLLFLSGRSVVQAQEIINEPDNNPAPAHTDFLYSDNKKIYQDIYIKSEADKKVNLNLVCYRYGTEGDSSLIFRYASSQKIKTGAKKITIAFQESTDDYYMLPAFSNIVRKTELIPPGSYKVFLSIKGNKDTTTYQQVFLREIDSTLSMNSSLRKGMNDVLQPAAHNLLPSSNAASAFADKVSNALEKSRFRMDRYFKKRGLTAIRYNRDGKEVIDLYADGWFMGRYELDEKQPLSQQLKGQQDALENNLGSFTKNNLGDYQSLLSQFRELKKNSRENSELTGEIALSANFASDQEEYSEQDNNYYEARGSIEFPLMDIPVSLSGYYTTQDKNRKAKASYVHFKYDAEKAKEQLMKLIGSYNKRYEQTIAQGGSFDMIYGQLVGELKTEKDRAIAELKQQAGLPKMDFSSLNEEQLKAALLNKANEEKDKLQEALVDSAQNSGAGKSIADKQQKAMQAKQKAEETYAKAMAQYERIQQLEKKIRKYEALLNQYKNTSYYDSLLAYSKSKELQNLDQTSYKDLAKKASGLLPESKTKSMITGLTNFDAGMFPKYVSDYTQSGQILKGVDAGYDIGFAEIGGSYGKTEYIDRDGNVEGYKAYSGRVQFKPVMEQKFGLLYYGYSPGKKLLSDDGFFKDVSVSMPSFRNPVHIISAIYSGKISKYVIASGEYAVSNKQGQSEAAKEQSSFYDKSAYNVKLEGIIPSNNINLEAAYEHAGKSFENNTLPVLMSGTERLRASGQGDLFNNFLTVGVEYNYLIQNSFSSKGNNTKWGFNLATHSKRYPSVSLSYKPFSTFRSFNDTLNIEQKPILGEVWTGKINYQIKKRDRAIRFTLLYNRNTSTMDTVKYGSALIQFNTIYSYKTTTLSLNLGSSKINTDYIETAYPAFNNSKFANISASGNVATGLMLTGGTDIALANAMISRYGIFVGSGYTFKKLPFMIRANFRYTNYRLTELIGWKQLYSGGIELAWRFKAKLFKN
ncbi:MAG: hypothetical protein WC756_06665 [Taibaiella sp.]|jgi:hypothetical protein